MTDIITLLDAIDEIRGQGEANAVLQRTLYNQWPAVSAALREALAETKRLHELHYERTKLTEKIIKEREAAEAKLELAHKWLEAELAVDRSDYKDPSYRELTSANIAAKDAFRSALRDGEGEKDACPPHDWDRDGERCRKCGDKDWM